MSQLEWRDPPSTPRRVDLCAAQLRARPGQWARIATSAPAFEFFPWWTALANSPDFEVKYVHVDDRAFGPSDVYARMIGPES